MTNDVEAERGRLEQALMRLGMATGMPSADALARRNELIAQYQAQLAALPPRKPMPLPVRAPLPPGWRRPEVLQQHHRSSDCNPFDASPTARRDDD